MDKLQLVRNYLASKRNKDKHEENFEEVAEGEYFDINDYGHAEDTYEIGKEVGAATTVEDLINLIGLED